MKKILGFSVKAVLVVFLCAALIPGCKKNQDSSVDVLDKDASYAFGMFMANVVGGQMGLTNVRLDYKAFTEGFEAFLEAKETRLTLEQAMEKLNMAFMQIQEKESEQMRKEGDAYLAENGRKGGVVTTASGLQYEVITQGHGEKPSAFDNVRVHYEGTLVDGTVFDSSYDRGMPIEFNLSQVIPGWTEGVQLMNEGSKYRLVIPYDLAYGPGGSGPIPPFSTLIFTVELIAILK